MLFRCALAALAAAVLPAAAAAQSFDCAKARSPAEKAICTDPALGALDRALADAFAAATARAGDGAAALRVDETAWVRSRDAKCNVPARLASCLAETMTARVAALAPPVAGQTAPAVPPAVSIPSAANPQPAEASLDRTSLPAAGPGETLLRVRSAGRFALQARSATGAALQLVDMMSGPAPAVGEPGVHDGRTDVLLDVGVYKLRVLPAEHATGDVQLAVTPFRDAAPPAAAPAPGDLLTATLADTGQLAFWIAIGPDGRIEVDAAGRALADLRLWRGGADLEPLQPESRVVEPVKGHPMLRLRLSGVVEPGAYLVVAYGGPALGWADGAGDMPLFLRAGASPRLRDGWASGTVGPMGSELFAAPARAGLFRLDLPNPAAATLTVDGQSAAVAANSRDPSVAVGTGPNRQLVEVSGAAGQPFQLRAQETSLARSLTKPGRYWVSASVRGAGGDEAPPTLLLASSDGKSPWRVLASTAPRVGPGAPWRTQFNVRGPTTLLLQNTVSGEVLVRNASQNLLTLHWQPHSATLPADFAEYAMEPPDGRQGVVDLTFGGAANGPAPAAAAHWPADPVIPFGVQTVEPTQQLVLDSNSSPILQAGLLARPVPVALAEGPLTITQMPGVALDVPVRVAAGGTLAVSDPAHGDLPVPFRPAPDGSGTVSLPAPDAPRTVVLSWRASPQPRAAIPAPPRRADVAALGTGAPRFLDLRRDERRPLDLVVDRGGLFRVETVGRLHTALDLGTAFNPALDHADANGAGQNALVQRWLRAGRYRVAVRAMESAGHLGVLAAPAQLREGAPLLPGGSVRATMPAGTGLSVPVRIAAAGRYKLELQGLARTFNARLDDADGWPLTAPGPLDTLEQAFAPGTYRLLVSPEAVDASLVARLTPVLDAQRIEDHGPHALRLGRAGAHATWREPAGRDDPRVPDDWTFTLYGPADGTLRVTNGMVADLQRDGALAPVARVAGPVPASLHLEAGSYHIRAASLGRNDRLAYTLSFDSAELQPGVPRTVAADAQTPFTLAEARVVSLTTGGRTPLNAVLRDGDGRVIGRYGNRADDWNVAVSRNLPAGRYRLDLQPSVPPDMTDTPAPANPPAVPDAVAAKSDDSDDSADAPPPDQGEPAPQSAGQAAAADAPTDATPDDNGQAGTPSDKKPTVELMLSLPDVHDAIPAPSGAVVLADGGVHRLTAPTVGDGQLILATSQSAVPVVLSVERRGADGAWATVGAETGLTPVVAVGGTTGEWRASVWPVDGGALPVTASVSVLDAKPQPLGVVTLRPVDGTAVPVFAAAVQPDAPGPVALAGGVTAGAVVTGGVIAGGWPGHPLAAPAGGTVLPQEGVLWVVARTGAPIRSSLVQAVAGQATVLSIPPGAFARLAAPPHAAGVFRAWRAESGLGQPGLDAGSGMGVAPGSALAAGTAPVRAWDAGGGGDALRPRITPLDLAVQPPQTLDEAASVLLPPMSATHLTLPAGERRTDLALAAGVAAVAGRGENAITVWTGDTAHARSVGGDWTDLVLLNTGTAAAPASVAWTPGVASAPLRPGMVMKRFFGASGSFDVALEAPAGARLRLVGDAVGTFAGADGRVQHGTGLTPGGSGRLTVAHAPGPLAVWLDVPGTSPWPDPAPVPQTLPGLATMSGPAMALSLPVSAPVLLHVRSTAPVILRLGDAPPVLYPAGAVLSRTVTRPAVLRVDSPHDGPLSGTLELTADPVIPAGDGLGAPVALAPGAAVAFSFQLAAGADLGVGVRADPDRVSTRLLAADGTTLGEGEAFLRRVPAGRYLLEVSLPPDAPAAVVRAAVVGIGPRPSGPPPEIVQHYLELVGLKPKGAP